MPFGALKKNRHPTNLYDTFREGFPNDKICHIFNELRFGTLLDIGG
jgi:hypothetical protein